MSPADTQLWKMPPIVKIYEAIGAIGDGRVTLEDDHHASVCSSDGSKTYQVEISADGRGISSNDNASYWQGYLGYPAIAVILMRGLYRVRDDVIEALSGIEWKELNRRFRNDYERTIREVMQRAEARGLDTGAIATEVEAVLRALHEFAPTRGMRRRPAHASRVPNTNAAPATSPPRSGSRPRNRNNPH
ncbi:MAG TPA: hypothetical protein VJN94_06075 [Candidatus Binataceae bacterium]|nr:hypothetical protein [Candidatus Binataceae bacterium]